MGAIIGWIIFGIIAGGIAKLLMPGRDPGGWIVTMVLGIAGAVVGGWIGRAIWGSTGVNDWSIGSFTLAIVGAVLLLAIYRMIVGRRKPGDVVTRDRDKWAA
ncbi:MAG TPA: GlsB/YeaQ/YmgE family stress response membrane protein [Clostridia bacterium]|nr:GlsB/YeaQ/YmgE family stress response membrane protein [Clostridia bacterium]